MIPVDETDGFDLGPDLEGLGGALELEVLDECDGIAIDEDIAVGVLHHAGFNRFGFVFPLMTTGDTLPSVRVV